MRPANPVQSSPAQPSPAQSSLVQSSPDSQRALVADSQADKLSQLNLLVNSPGSWIAKRDSTALTFSDQIPVWLRVEAGRMLVDQDRLRTAAEQAKARRQNRAARAQAGKEDAEPSRKNSPQSEP